MNESLTVSSNNAVGNAAAGAHDVVDRAAQKAAPAIDRVANAAHRTIDKAAEAATPAAQWVGDQGSKLANTSTDLAEACSTQIRAQPLVAVGGALVLGYIFGKLMR